MAGLLFIEGFETFGANGDTGSGLQDILKQKFAGLNLSTSAKLSNSAYDGSGLCLDCVIGDGAYKLVQSHHTTSHEVIVGFAWYTGSLADNDYIFRSVSTSGQLLGFYALTTGALRIYYGTGNYTTSAGLVSANTWYYIELKFKLDDATGYWKLYIDGVLKDSQVNFDNWLNSNSREISQHHWLPRNNNTRFDDIYVYDNTGDVQEPFGPVKVRALFPNGDDTTDWTSTGANHYDQVNDVPVDTANYVESDTSNDVDLFDFTDTTDPSEWPIYGVQLNVYAAVTDVGLFTLEGVADSNGSQETVNEAIIDHLGGQYSFVFETDPETSNTWTKSQLDSAIFGVGVE